MKIPPCIWPIEPACLQPSLRLRYHGATSAGHAIWDNLRDVLFLFPDSFPDGEFPAIRTKDSLRPASPAAPGRTAAIPGKRVSQPNETTVGENRRVNKEASAPQKEPPFRSRSSTEITVGRGRSTTSGLGRPRPSPALTGIKSVSVREIHNDSN